MISTESFYDNDEYQYDKEGEGIIDFNNSISNGVNVIDFSSGKRIKDGWIEFELIGHRGGPHQICILYQNFASRVPLMIKLNNRRVYRTQALSIEEPGVSLKNLRVTFGYREPIIFDLRSAQKLVSISFKAANGGRLNIKSFYFDIAKLNEGNYHNSIPFHSASQAPSSFQKKSSLIFCSDEKVDLNKDDDGWVIFKDVRIHGDATKQKLWMRYTSIDSRPMDISINGKIVPHVTVANRCTSGWSDEDLKWFSEPFVFDLTEYMDGVSDRMINVAFKAWSYFPHLASFVFREITNTALDDQEEVLLKGVGQHKKTPFVFHFDVGSVGNKDEKYVVAESFALTGRKPLTFRSGECNDAMTVGSKRLGTREGGTKLPAITFVDDNDRISEMKIGMSFFAGDDVSANFCAAIEHIKFHNDVSDETKEVDGLSANLRTEDTTIWTYNRQKLGLDLWLTSAYYMKGAQGTKSNAIFKYGFALSASEGIPFNIEAFEEFWQWLVTIKYHQINFEVVGPNNTPLQRMKNTQYDFGISRLSDVELRMQDLHDFLIATYAGPNTLTPWTGFLRGTKTHLSLTHDCFHIFVKLIPDINYDEKIISTLFVDGKQYDPEGRRFGNLSSDPLDIQSYSILSILEDLEMLFEMDLLRSHDLVLSQEREVLSLRSGNAFVGTYEKTRSACRAFHFLATAGIRKVSIEEVFTSEEPWDIYDLAAGCNGIFNVPTITAITCTIIQTVSPILLGIRAFYSDKEEEVIFVVYVTRVIFAIYAVFYELKLQSDYSDEARLASFLSMLPEFNPQRLLVGLFINLGAKLSLSIGIIILLWFSYTVIDVTLNSLALYFILDLDNYLVSLVDLDDFRAVQENALFEMKFVSSRYYFKYDLEEAELWTFENWSFYNKIIKWIHNANFIAILLGACWIMIAPFFLGNLIINSF